MVDSNVGGSREPLKRDVELLSGLLDEVIIDQEGAYRCGTRGPELACDGA